MYIEKVSSPTDEIRVAIQRLVPQLGAHKSPPDDREISLLVQSAGSTLLIARHPDESGEIIGMLSLTIYRVPTGLRSIVEDVVVDENMRNKGAGEVLVRTAIELAREAGAVGVSLTSNPQREAANRLYRSIGFSLRNTNSYYYQLE